MLTDFEKLFPGLSGTPYRVTSPKDDVYNCIAWAAGRTSEWWWPHDAPGHYWPAGIPKEETLPAFQALFDSLGFSICSDGNLEIGFEKIALFAAGQGIPAHAARQYPNGRWTSKLGKLEDIEHDLQALEGVEYGTVALVMKRPVS